jgi:hypothetical protein
LIWGHGCAGVLVDQSLVRWTQEIVDVVVIGWSHVVVARERGVIRDSSMFIWMEKPEAIGNVSSWHDWITGMWLQVRWKT